MDEAVKELLAGLAEQSGQFSQLAIKAVAHGECEEAQAYALLAQLCEQRTANSIELSKLI